MTDHTETLKLIMRTLQIPAAEYVPAIGDVFTLIENALRHDNPPATGRPEGWGAVAQAL